MWRCNNLFRLNSTSKIGKERRLNRIFKDGKCIIVPLDDSLISGAKLGLYNLDLKISELSTAKPNGVLGYIGSLSLLSRRSSDIPIILNLTASTERSSHTNKTLITDIQRALTMDVDAVAVHINITSIYESRMLEIVGKVSDECDKYGLPMMLITYPRGEIFGDKHQVADNNYSELRSKCSEKYTELVSHCVRIGFELGADIIKTQYTGSKSSFESVVQSAQGVPLLVAGGEMQEDYDLFSMCRDAIDAGAAGVCIGRNVFNRQSSQNILTVLKEIVINGISVEEAIDRINVLERCNLQ